jgi:hypothetical protein
MRSGAERCRNCGTLAELTFDHVIPASVGGLSAFDNVTILCEPCNKEKGEELWPHLISLAEEERRAAPERQWVARATEAREQEEGRRKAALRGEDGALNVDEARRQLRAAFGSCD